MMQGMRQQSVTQSVNQLLYWLTLIRPLHRHWPEYFQDFLGWDFLPITNTAPSILTCVDCADIQNVVETQNACVRQRDDGIAAPSHLTLVNCQMDCANIQNVAKTQLACTRQHDDGIAGEIIFQVIIHLKLKRLDITFVSNQSFCVLIFTCNCPLNYKSNPMFSLSFQKALLFAVFYKIIVPAQLFRSFK